MRSGNEAFCLWDGSLTYAELARRSNRLARYLVVALQIGPESLVPVCFYKSKWSVVAILGVMKAGELLCPFDPSKVLANNSPGSARTVHFSTL